MGTGGSPFGGFEGSGGGGLLGGAAGDFPVLAPNRRAEVILAGSCHASAILGLFRRVWVTLAVCRHAWVVVAENVGEFPFWFAEVGAAGWKVEVGFSPCWDHSNRVCRCQGNCCGDGFSPCWGRNNLVGSEAVIC